LFCASRKQPSAPPAFLFPYSLHLTDYPCTVSRHVTVHVVASSATLDRSPLLRALDPEIRTYRMLLIDLESLIMFLDSPGRPCFQLTAVVSLRGALHLRLASRGRCILPLAVNTAVSACADDIPLLAGFDLLSAHSPSAATTLSRQNADMKAMSFGCHCSPGFSLRWRSHGGWARGTSPVATKAECGLFLTFQTVIPQKAQLHSLG
jgi:hypothetical protein